jgi:hypothetical protein
MCMRAYAVNFFIEGIASENPYNHYKSKNRLGSLINTGLVTNK